jgi:hypothetical protein
MPDELDALRHFRDETPGPSTGAWTRARAAIVAAQAHEAPAGREPGRRSPGRRSPGRKPGRRRVLWIVTVGAAAALAGLLAVLLPGSLASRGTGGQVETTAFVTHVEHALSELGHRNLIGYARSVYPPGYSAEPVSPGGLRVSPSTGAGSPWNVRYLVVWAYQRVSKESAFSAAGYRVFDLRFAPVHGTLTSTGVIYHSRTWWRGAIGPAPVQGGPPPTQCGPGIRLGTGGWPTFIRYELSCGEFTKGGQQRIGGIEAIQLTGNGGRETIWVNPRTYLPVRTVFSAPGGPQLQTDFGWFTPTRARLAELRLPVPPGFRQVAPPAQPSGPPPGR